MFEPFLIANSRHDPKAKSMISAVGTVVSHAAHWMTCPLISLQSPLCRALWKICLSRSSKVAGGVVIGAEPMLQKT